jgi:hypothetical protein
MAERKIKLTRKRLLDVFCIEGKMKTPQVALSAVFEVADKAFFNTHPDRAARLRLPYKDECSGEFWHIGGHNRALRRIIIWRIPRNSPYYDPIKQPLLKLPILAFADEEIADTDETLLPIIETIMSEAAQNQGGTQ